MGIVPLNVSVLIVVLGVNPVPLTVTVMPVGPCVGVSVITGVVTVNDAVALSLSPSDPAAVTVYGVPDAVPEIVTVQLTVPVPDTVAPHAPIVAPAPIVVVTVAPRVNPVPDTPTDTPLGPCVGVSVITGVVTVNDAVALSKLPSDPVAVTVYVTADPLTANVQLLNVPVPVAVHELADPIVPPVVIVNVIVTSGVNPLPDAVTVTPLSPCVGVSANVGTVTVNVPVAASPPTSVTVTVVPDVPLGTANVQLRTPTPPAVREPLVQLAIATPSKTSPTVRVTENPVPDTVTVAPTGPCVGLTMIPGNVTVNVQIAVWPPTSVAVTVIPDVPLGTLNVHVNAPAALVVKEPLVQLATVTPSKTSPTARVTEKPVPETVTVAPTGPWVGFTVIAGDVTVNAPVATWPPTPVAVTVVPDVPLGTLNVHVNTPVPPVVKEPLVQLAIVTPSKTSPTALVTENPVPEIVTVAPTGPWVGLTVIAGVVTVNVCALVGVFVSQSSPATS